MKKFLLLLIGLSSWCAASALQLTFWMGNQKITPGTTVQFTDITVTTYEDYKEVEMIPNIYLSTDLYSSSIKVVATCTSGQEIQMCAGDLCEGGKSVTKNNVKIQTNQKLDLKFDYTNYEMELEEEIPTVVTLLEAEDTTEEGSKIQFILEMGPKGSSVTAIEVDEALKAADGGVAYSCDEPQTLTIATVGGQTVFSDTVSGTGFVTLAKGLYVYAFGGKSGKVYVK